MERRLEMWNFFLVFFLIKKSSVLLGYLSHWLLDFRMRNGLGRIYLLFGGDSTRWQLRIGSRMTKTKQDWGLLLCLFSPWEQQELVFYLTFWVGTSIMHLLVSDWFGRLLILMIIWEFRNGVVCWLLWLSCNVCIFCKTRTRSSLQSNFSTI